MNLQVVHLYNEGGLQMKIWQLNFDVDNYDNLIPDKEFSADEILSFNGTSKEKSWIPLKVKRMEPEKGLELGDAPGFIIPVFSEKALDILRPIIINSTEVLDLILEEGKYYGINVIAVLNVIDYSKSEYRMYSDGQRIMAFRKYAFIKKEELIKHHIFKIVDEPTRRAFVSDKFKSIVEDSSLTGFIFKQVWDSEE